MASVGRRGDPSDRSDLWPDPGGDVSTFAWVCAALAAAFAVVDWVMVVVGNRPGRHVTKPGALIALTLAAATLDPGVESSVRWVMVIGLVLSLAGDVFLLLPDKWFIAGLASFLAAHVAYIVAFWMTDISVVGLLAGVAIVAVCLVVVGPRFRPALRDERNRAMVVPGCLYAAVISAMVVSAFGVWSTWAIVGAFLFYVSDATLAWNRFLEQRRFGNIAVMVTYHLGQAGLVAWIAWP